MKDIRRGLWLIAIGISMLFFSTYIHAEDEVRPEKEWKKGAVIVAVKNDGGCVYRPFIVVGLADPDNDGDQPQNRILGFEPGNIQVSKKGDVIWEHILETVFIPRGGAKMLRGRMCKCPPYSF